MAAPAREPGRSRAPSTSSARRCPTSRSSSSTWRPPAARRPTSRSPRSARSRSAAARCSASSRPWCDPGAPIPPFIAVLTGITDAMVARRAADRVGRCPAFLEFARGSVLVAHNAAVRHRLPQGGGAASRAPLAGLRGARHRAPGPAAGHPRRGAATASSRTLAGSSARPTTPDHRALARRPGHRRRAARRCSSGSATSASTSLEELRATPRGSRPAQRRKRHLAEHAAAARRASTSSGTRAAESLYVGTSRDLRTRVRTYFTASETAHPDGRDGRPRRAGRPDRVRDHRWRREVRELRLIAEHKPRYNRRSRYPERAIWVKLTVEPFPRLSIVREVTRRRRRATSARSGRRAPPRPPSPPSTRPSRCASAPQRLSPRATDVARACSPRWAGAARRARARRPPRTYAGDRRRRAAPAMTGDAAPGRRRAAARMAAAVRAGAVRGRRRASATGCSASSARPPRTQRIAPLRVPPELVAARRAEAGGWEIVVRPARPAGRHHASARAAPTRCPTSRRAAATAEVVARRRAPGARGDARGDREDPALAGGARRAAGRRRRPWTCPVGGAGSRAPSSTPAAASADAVPVRPDRRRPASADALPAGRSQHAQARARQR